MYKTVDFTVLIKVFSLTLCITFFFTYFIYDLFIVNKLGAKQNLDIFFITINFVGFFFSLQHKIFIKLFKYVSFI